MSDNFQVAVYRVIRVCERAGGCAEAAGAFSPEVSSPCLVWFRQDLRLSDNPALAAARDRGGPVIPVYVDEAGTPGAPGEGNASRWWLHHSLLALAAQFAALGSRLMIRRGQPRETIAALAAESGARAAYWNRSYEPVAMTRDRAVSDELTINRVEVKTFNASLLFEPSAIANKQGRPFQVFTPFWRHCQAQPVGDPLAGPRHPRALLLPPKRWPPTLTVDALGLAPPSGGDAEFGQMWTPGEQAARRALKRFVAGPIDAYAERRNFPGVVGTSRLSPHLHFGEIGPRQVWSAVKAKGAARGVFPPSRGAGVFLSEIGWREFAYHLLFHFPDTRGRPFRPEFATFPWRDDPGGRLLENWCEGRTGYPIVDAGMRELRATGWMHNRVRMIAASFLVKHLRLPWQAGAKWFADSLVDADLANNTLGWQWSAGCGADAAPYFRIFSPELQGGRFDQRGNYVRRWVPELARLPDAWLHHPWDAPTDQLARADVILGKNYPAPLVDHKTARAEALAAYRQLKTNA